MYNELRNPKAKTVPDFVKVHGIDHKIPESARNIWRKKASAIISLPFENDGPLLFRRRPTNKAVILE